MPQVTGKHMTKLEKIIDRCQKDLAWLKEFILPGGGKGVWLFASGESGLPSSRAAVCASLAGRAGRCSEYPVRESSERCPICPGTIVQQDARGAGIPLAT